MSRTLVLSSPPPPGLQEATKNSTVTWQNDLESLFKHAKDRFPDVVWELTGDEDDPNPISEDVWGHKAIVYARAPPSFQSRYFSFRPNNAASPLPYSSSPTDTFPAESSLSLGLGLDIPPSILSRTPSPFRSLSPTPTANGQQSLLRIATSINPALFSNELEYLYTGQGFGEAFEFLFDSSADHGYGEDDDPEAMRIDKLRKDLVFMWRSRLYSDVRISLTGNFSSSNHESTTAIFSSHRFILVSRSPYFHSVLLDWPTSKNQSTNGEPPTLTLPSPPFTPASLHFTLGYIYTGTLIFSHRSYDLSTAFAILRAAYYLGLSTLQDEVQARIAHEMLHGLFHAFLPFPEYERLTGGKWGTGGCRCRQCARRAPRVLEFSLAEDVKNQHLERGARRALVGMFGEGWCSQEFAELPPKLRESLLKGVAKRTTHQNVFPLLFAAEHALQKLGSVIEPWGDIVREMIFSARKLVDETICKEAEGAFGSEEWLTLMEEDGGRFEDGERVEWAMAAVLRGVKEQYAATLYQILVSSILLRPHPTEENAPLLSTTSHIRVQVEQTRLELLKWIGKRWIGTRQEQGFDSLEGWALKEISDHIEVPIEDLLNPLLPSTKGGASHHVHPHPIPKTKQATNLLRPTSQHPHTSRIDAESDAASSMRVSVLSRNSRNLPSYSSTRRGTTPTKDNGSMANSSSIRSSAKSTTSFDSAASGSTIGANRRRANDEDSTGMSPARRIAAAARSGTKIDFKDRPDSKLTPASSAMSSRSPSPRQPSIVESNYDEQLQFGGEHDDEHRREEEGSGDDADQNLSLNRTENEQGEGKVNPSLSQSSTNSTPMKKTLITRASLGSVTSRGTTSTAGGAAGRPKSSASSIRSQHSTFRKSSATTGSVRTPFATTASTSTSSLHRPGSRGSTRTTASTTPSRSATTRSTLSSRPVSSLSASTSGRPTSSISNSNTATTDSTTSTFRTASAGLSTPVVARSRRTSAASTTSVRTTGTASNVGSPVTPRARQISGGSVNSVTSNAGSIHGRSPASAKKNAPPVPALDPTKLTPAAAKGIKAASLRSVSSGGSVVSNASATKKTVTPAPIKKVLSVGKKVDPAPAPASVEERPVVNDYKPAVDESDVKEEEKEDLTITQPIPVEPETQPDPPNSASTMMIKPKASQAESLANAHAIGDHKKTSSSASSSSVATLKRKGSSDTITKMRVSSSHHSNGSMTNRKSWQHRLSVSSKSQSMSSPPVLPTDFVPRGATLDIGIPCIISSKRKRFKAYARYIGEVEGELGPWVGVEVPMPAGETWGADRSTNDKTWEDRQWNDGSWGGIRYFEINNAGSDIGEDRAARRRRIDAGSVGGAVWGSGKGVLKREGDQLSVSMDRLKRVRSSSPAPSDTSSMVESRGLFVRPQQVLYVVDAVGADL